MAGRPRSFDRNTVIERAMELFWEKGFEGTHLQELVERTGLNRFSLYKEFGGKEGLFQTALGHYIQIMEAEYDRILGRDPAGRENIFTYFQGMKFSDPYNGCMMINTITEKNVVSAESFAMAKALARKAEDLFLKNLKAAQKNGEIDENINPAFTARTLTALDQGLAVYGHVLLEPAQDRNAIGKANRALKGIVDTVALLLPAA